MKNNSSVPPHSDHDKYIEGIRAKKNDIITDIYRSYSDNILAYVKRNNGTDEDGMDVFQEALEKIVKKALYSSFVLTYPFHLYLFGTCRNLWLKTLERKGKEENSIRNQEFGEYISRDDFEKLIEDTIDGDKWVLLLERTFSQLTDLCRQLLSLFRQGKSVSEISKALDMKANAIYVRKNACLKSWREKMEMDQDFNLYNPY